MKKRIGFLLVLLLGICICFAGCTNGKQVEDEHKDEQETTAEGYEIVVEEEEDGEVDLIMVGDILLHENVQESGWLEDGTRNYDHLFAHVKDDVQDADIAIVNQEVILGGEEIGFYGFPTFNGPYEIGDALVDAGFNVILHATNHTLDHGKEALMNCLNFWKENHSEVAVLGVFETQEAYDNDIYVHEQEGIRIAILNYTYGTNGMPFPEDMPFAVAMLDEEKICADLEKANEIADFIVVCPHWGKEYEHVESEKQREWTELFLENGVDLVIGTHSHVIQPVKMFENEAGEEMLVYYSLGNFINSTARSGRGTADQMVGAMAEVTIAKDENGKVYIKEYGVEPLITQLLYGTQEITTYKISDYTKKLASKNKILKKDEMFSLEYCQDLCEEVFGDLYTRD